MARLGTNLLHHRLELVIKGDGKGIYRLLDVDNHGAVIDGPDEGEPWHVAGPDIARWRIVCGCDLRTIRGHDCDLDNQPRYPIPDDARSAVR